MYCEQSKVISNRNNVTINKENTIVLIAGYMAVNPDFAVMPLQLIQRRKNGEPTSKKEIIR